MGAGDTREPARWNPGSGRYYWYDRGSAGSTRHSVRYATPSKRLLISDGDDYIFQGLVPGLRIARHNPNTIS